jgi:hypothetical protein
MAASVHAYTLLLDAQITLEEDRLSLVLLTFLTFLTLHENLSSSTSEYERASIST